MSTTLRRRRGEGRPVLLRPAPDEAPAGRARRRPWRLLLALLAVLALAGAVAWVVLGSSLLGVDRVSVTRATGTSAVPVEEVLERAAVLPGTPLARVDTAAVAARVGGLARVEAVEVHRRWPGTLAVVVTERRPLAVEPLDERAYAVLDRHGVALQRVAAPPDALPVLGVGGTDGSPTTGTADARTAALGVLASLPDGLLAQVRSVSATSPDDVTLALAQERTVVWGSVDRATRKALVLTALLRIEAEVYDVSAPDVPTTR